MNFNFILSLTFIDFEKVIFKLHNDDLFNLAHSDIVMLML